MLILLDTANVNEISRMMDIYPLDGVTTNPTIVSKEKKDFYKLLEEIRNVIGEEKMLHVQVVGKSSEEMIEEALYIRRRIKGNLYIKVPVIPEGIKAMKILKEEGLNITATAVFTEMQALVAAKAGADFIAPYVNRIDNMPGDGVKVVSDIVKAIKIYNFDSKVLAASFKNVQQVYETSLAGAHAVTAPPDIIEKLIYHPLTDLSVSQFVKDWESAYGEGKLTKDV